MEFNFEIENKDFIINIKDMEHYKIIEMTVCQNIVIYPVWFKVVGISNNKKFSGLISVSESIFLEEDDFLNKYINQSIENRFEDLLISGNEW